MQESSLPRSPAVSVIVPAYNEEEHIGHCLASLVRQKTDYPYEIILVDNNSTDRTAAAAKMSSVRVVTEHKQGRAYARNAGIKAARGFLLAFTEADCIVPPGWIQTIGDFFRKHPDAIGVTGGIRFDQQDRIINRLAPMVLRAGNMLLMLSLGNTTFRGSTFAIPKNIQKTVGTFSPNAVPFDDVEFGFRAGKIGRIYFEPDLTVTTDDRRIRGRLLSYLREYITSYTRLFILKKTGDDLWFSNIRT